MISFDEAMAIIDDAARPLGTTHVPLAAAYGRIVAEPVIAGLDAPRSAVSTMDGYAVREADLPVRALRVVGQSFPGAGFAGRIGAGECVRIFTGAPLPAGADRVLIQEIVERSDDRAIVAAPCGSARYVRERASDFAAGDVLLPVGTRLSARAIVAVGGADLAGVEVFRRPGVTILGTGDELTEPGTARRHPERIPESLSFGIAALATDWGADVLGRSRVEDDPAALEAAATAALNRSDLLLVTGGASVGERDYAQPALLAVGLEMLFSKVAIKPGKPVWFGRVRGKLAMGLPGNPTSAMVTARLLLAPLLLGIGGRDPREARRWSPGPLAARLGPTGDRETFLRGAWEGDMVRPISNQDSGAQRALADATLLIRRCAGAPAVDAGDAVDVLEF